MDWCTAALRNAGIFQYRPMSVFQILNSNDNHWVILYAVNYAPGELQMYDSLCRTVSKDIKELVDTQHMTALRFTMPDMVMLCTTKSVHYQVFSILM